MNKMIVISIVLLLTIIILQNYLNINKITEERNAIICQNFCREAKLSEGKFSFTTMYDVITCDCSSNP